MSRSARSLLVAAAVAAVVPAFAAKTHAVAAQAVHFPSADGQTELVGYLFAPAGPGCRRPAGCTTAAERIPPAAP